MAFKSTRHKQVVPLHISPVGGLRLDLPPQAIKDEELTSAHNMLYLPNNSVLATRPVFVPITGTPLAAEIRNMVQFGVDTDDAGTEPEDFVVVSADDNKIYALDTATKVFTFLANIPDGVVATFLVFNDKLLWADTAGLWAWNGSAVTEVTGGLLKPSICVEIGGRVVINNTGGGDPDGVYFSGPEDETDWDTSAGGAIMVRAGFGDGMAVNGLAVLGQDIFVSKKGRSKRFIYRVNTAGMPQQWQSMKLSSDTSAKGELLFAGLPNDIFYVNEDAELRSLSGITEYGDLRASNAGEKVNTLLHNFQVQKSPPSSLNYLPSYDILACIFDGHIVCYHIAGKRFTEIDFFSSGVKLLCATDIGDVPHFAGDSGHIYRFSETGKQDIPMDAGSGKDLTSRVRSKRYFVPGDVIIKRIDVSLTAIASGKGVIEIIGRSGKVVMMKPFILHSSVQLLFDAHGDLFDALGDLNEGETEGSVETVRNRTRTQDFYVQVRTLSGRIGINSIDLQVAMVQG